jgi:excisionase family DNA binding protein
LKGRDIMDDIKVYTLKEVASLLKVTERTLLTYLKEKKLKGNKIGGKWIISQENLQNFINGK